jgi:octaprenyl-diphosphate synthase
VGIDIKEKKMTLPLIHLLNHTDRSVKRKVINTVKNHNTDKARVSELIELVTSNGGMDYAKGKMKEYQDLAIKSLDDFPESKYREAMKNLVLFTTRRKK